MSSLSWVQPRDLVEKETPAKQNILHLDPEVDDTPYRGSACAEETGKSITTPCGRD